MLVFPIAHADETLCSGPPAGCARWGGPLQSRVAIKVSSVKKRLMEVWTG